MAVSGNLKCYVLLMIGFVMIIAFIISTNISFNMISVSDVSQKKEGVNHIKQKTKGTKNTDQKRMDENVYEGDDKTENEDDNIEQQENEIYTDYVKEQEIMAEQISEYENDGDVDETINSDDTQPSKANKEVEMHNISHEDQMELEYKSELQYTDTQNDDDEMEKESNSGRIEAAEYDNVDNGENSKIEIDNMRKTQKNSNEAKEADIGTVATAHNNMDKIMQPQNDILVDNVQRDKKKDDVKLCKVQHFMIITQPRSGSNLLDSYINQHPYITSYSELCHDSILAKFNMTKKSPKADILRHIQNSLKRDIHTGNGCAHLTTGFKLHIWSLETLSTSITDIVQSLENPKIIILYRKNMLEQYISWEAASKNHLWWSTFLVNRYTFKIEIPLIRDFILRQKQNMKSVLLELTRLNLKHIMEITYEDLVNDKTKVMNDLFIYLGYAPTDRNVVSFLVKQNPLPLKKKLKNYDEIMAYFSESDLTLDIDDLDNVR